MTTTTAGAPAPTTTRAIAPDLARGLMLALIAVANVSWWLYGGEVSSVSAHRAGATGADAVFQAIAIVAVDARSYPLFAFLFGYGIWQLYSRQQSLGRDERAARRLLQVRHLLLLVFGAVHAALLWQGDVLGAYGLAGLVVVWLFLRRRDKTLLVWVAVLVGLLTVAAVLSLLGGLVIPPEMVADTEVPMPQLAGTESYPASIGERLTFWLALVPLQGLIGLAVPIAILLGIVAARHRVLEAPEQHRRLLVRTAAIGIPIGWLGAVPAVLVQLGVWDVPDWTASILHIVTGLGAALGYAALFGLLGARVVAAGEPGPLARAITAVGKRSLTCYLLQSVVFGALLAAWGLGLGGVVTQWQAALVAIGTWALTVAVAAALERTGTRGPAEWLLRRLAYRGQQSAATPIR